MSSKYLQALLRHRPQGRGPLNRGEFFTRISERISAGALGDVAKKAAELITYNLLETVITFTSNSYISNALKSKDYFRDIIQSVFDAYSSDKSDQRSALEETLVHEFKDKLTKPTNVLNTLDGKNPMPQEGIAASENNFRTNFGPEITKLLQNPDMSIRTYSTTIEELAKKFGMKNVTPASSSSTSSITDADYTSDPELDDIAKKDLSNFRKETSKNTVKTEIKNMTEKEKDEFFKTYINDKYPDIVKKDRDRFIKNAKEKTKDVNKIDEVRDIVENVASIFTPGIYKSYKKLPDVAKNKVWEAINNMVVNPDGTYNLYGVVGVPAFGFVAYLIKNSLYDKGGKDIASEYKTVYETSNVIISKSLTANEELFSKRFNSHTKEEGLKDITKTFKTVLPSLKNYNGDEKQMISDYLMKWILNNPLRYEHRPKIIGDFMTKISKSKLDLDNTLSLIDEFPMDKKQTDSLKTESERVYDQYKKEGLDIKNSDEFTQIPTTVDELDNLRKELKNKKEPSKEVAKVIKEPVKEPVSTEEELVRQKYNEEGLDYKDSSQFSSIPKTFVELNELRKELEGLARDGDGYVDNIDLDEPLTEGEKQVLESEIGRMEHPKFETNPVFDNVIQYDTQPIISRVRATPNGIELNKFVQSIPTSPEPIPHDIEVIKGVPTRILQRRRQIRTDFSKLFV